MLEQERKFYAQQLGEWMTRFPGKFVLVKGEQLVGVYDTNEDALREGARHFGLESFLVRRVEAEPEDVDIPALTLGLLRAGTTHSV